LVPTGQDYEQITVALQDQAMFSVDAVKPVFGRVFAQVFGFAKPIAGSRRQAYISRLMD
jgi:hypothetical protein